MNNLESLKAEQQRQSDIMVKNANHGFYKARGDEGAEEMEARYYEAKGKFEYLRKQINIILDGVKPKTPAIKTTKGRHENEVTSTTYIRAQNKLTRDHDRYFGRGMNKK